MKSIIVLIIFYFLKFHLSLVWFQEWRVGYHQTPWSTNLNIHSSPSPKDFVFLYNVNWRKSKKSLKINFLPDAQQRRFESWWMRRKIIFSAWLQGNPFWLFKTRLLSVLLGFLDNGCYFAWKTLFLLHPFLWVTVYFYFRIIISNGYCWKTFEWHEMRVIVSTPNSV